MILSKDELHALEDSLMLLSTYNQVKIENDNSVSCNWQPQLVQNF